MMTNPYYILNFIDNCVKPNSVRSTTVRAREYVYNPNAILLNRGRDRNASDRNSKSRRWMEQAGVTGGLGRLDCVKATSGKKWNSKLKAK
jgi:hypothetical protein